MRAILCVAGVFALAGNASADFYFNNLVVYTDFEEGSLENQAFGPSSVFSLGDAGTGGSVSVVNTGGVGGPGAAFFPQGTNTGSQLIYGGAGTGPEDAAVDIVGADGATYVLDINPGDSPNAANAPGWFYNHDSDNGQFGSRVQSNGIDFRARAGSVGGFFAGGDIRADQFYRIAYTIRPVGGGFFEAEAYIDGVSAGVSGTFPEVTGVTVGRIGAEPGGFEFRLSDALVDNVMLFGVGMTDEQIASIPTTFARIPEPMSAAALTVAGLLGLGRRRR